MSVISIQAHQADTDSAASHARAWPSGIALLGLIILLCVPWLRGIGKGEVHLMTDETRHAMNGVFVLDFLHDLPLRWPLLYAEEYYGKYPAMAIGHWPPGFYLVEAAFFAIFGISPWIARLAILPFAVLGAVFWYRIAREFVSIELAFVSTVVYACLPSVLLYEKAVMLEIPVLALSLGAIYFWILLLRKQSKRNLYLTAFFSVAALLTKPTAVFLFLFFGFHLVICKKWQLLKWIHTHIALLGAALFVTPWYLLVLNVHPTARGQAAGVYRAGHGVHLQYLLSYYIRTLPGALGWQLLILSLIGIAAAAINKQKAALGFFLPWIFACYVSLSFLSDRSPRYIMPWLLPFVFFAVYLVGWLLSRFGRFAILGLAAFTAVYYIPALLYQRPYVEGCEELARYLSQQARADVLFYQGDLNGDFIFFVRKFDPQKRRLIFREKIVDVTDRRWRQMHAGSATPELIDRILSGMGINYFVVENLDSEPNLSLTHAALRLNQFELVKEIPIQTNDPGVRGSKFLVYRSRQADVAIPDKIEIPMDTYYHNLQLSLSSLAGHPWPIPSQP
jgi:dolichyl-phosphate-mannose-protein mannosyltransferase